MLRVKLCGREYGDLPIDPSFHQLIPSMPRATREKPSTEPTILWVPEIGIFKNVARISQMALAPVTKNMERLNVNILDNTIELCTVNMSWYEQAWLN